MPSLFDPLTMGELSLPNRIVMSPLTRCRASPRRVPNAMMAEYYVQRASAGIIFSEATSVTPMGVGYPDTPGIWSKEQVEGWKQVTRAVHDAGGRMLLQLWHVGRISHPFYLDGAQPVAPSAIAAKGPVQPDAAATALSRAARAGARGNSRRHRSPTAKAPRMRWRPASTPSNCTARTATCSINSCRIAPTSAPTLTAARSRIARG